MFNDVPLNERCSVQRFTFQIPDYTRDELSLLNGPTVTRKVRFIAIGTSTKQPTALLGFVSLSKKTRDTSLATLLGCSRVVLLTARRKDADYAQLLDSSKDNFVSGETVPRGRRPTLQAVVEEMLESDSTDKLREVALKHPAVFVRNSRGLKDLLDLPKSGSTRPSSTYLWDAPVQASRNWP